MPALVGGGAFLRRSAPPLGRDEALRFQARLPIGSCAISPPSSSPTFRFRNFRERLPSCSSRRARRDRRPSPDISFFWLWVARPSSLSTKKIPRDCTKTNFHHGRAVDRMADRPGPTSNRNFFAVTLRDADGLVAIGGVFDLSIVFLSPR